MKRFLIAAAFLFFMVVAPVQAFDKSVWVEADGEAYLGEIETPKEVKERAKRDAESKAIEKAVGTFIKSHTVVSNSQLADDLIYASVRGQIDKVEILSEGWDEKDRQIYRMRIKALIVPVYPEKGESLLLKAFISKSDLKEGDEVKIFYQANSDCYVYIFSIAADGSVTLLLPNSTRSDNNVIAGKNYVFPEDASDVKLQARLLPGYNKAAEKIKVIATKKKEELIPLGFQEGFMVFDAKSTGMISDLVKRLNHLEPSEWTEATVTYKIGK